MQSKRSSRGLSRKLKRACFGAVAIAVLAIASAGDCLAYVGDSYLQMPGHEGKSRVAGRRGWIRIEAHDWMGQPRRVTSGPSKGSASGDNSGFVDRLYFSGPNVPKPASGGGKVAIVLGKANADLPFLMKLCSDGAAIAEISYAESSDRARAALELGPRPADLPAFWEYRLKNVRVVACPVVAGAADQAVVLSYGDIEWLNYPADSVGTTRIVIPSEDLVRVRPVVNARAGSVRSFVVTWMAPATDTADADCPALSRKPDDADIFRFMPEARRQAYRRAQAEAKAASPYGPLTEARGPDGLNVVLLPGIVPDPGDPEPTLKRPEGLDLHTRRDRSSQTRQAGIDNQLVKVMGCIPGYRGRQGYRNISLNRARVEGQVVMLVEISGIDDERNDDDVSVALIYSDDRPVLAAGSGQVIPSYTFRSAENPNFAIFNVRLRGRITNGVVTTDRMDQFHANLGQHAELRLADARMQFEIRPDGSLKGLIGGYLDWKALINGGSGYLEGLLSYQHPGLYYAMRRNADGLFNQETREFDGISAAYAIDGVPAFLTPSQATHAQ